MLRSPTPLLWPRNVSTEFPCFLSCSSQSTWIFKTTIISFDVVFSTSIDPKTSSVTNRNQPPYGRPIIRWGKKDRRWVGRNGMYPNVMSTFTRQETWGIIFRTKEGSWHKERIWRNKKIITVADRILVGPTLEFQVNGEDGEGGRRYL